MLEGHLALRGMSASPISEWELVEQSKEKMAPNLSTLPYDLLLNIAQHLDVYDVQVVQIVRMLYLLCYITLANIGCTDMQGSPRLCYYETCLSTPSGQTPPPMSCPASPRIPTAL